LSDVVQVESSLSPVFSESDNALNHPRVGQVDNCPEMLRVALWWKESFTDICGFVVTSFTVVGVDNDVSNVRAILVHPHHSGSRSFWDTNNTEVRTITSHVLVGTFHAASDDPSFALPILADILDFGLSHCVRLKHGKW
jgi:hypothetical protein